MSTLQTELEERGPVTIIRAKGKITIGEGDIRMKQTIDGLLGNGKTLILLDLGQVTFMDSSGVGELIACFTAVTTRDGKLKLLNLTKRIKDLLMVTKLHTYFDVFDDEQAALDSFA